ncbi:ABC transporter substrate-binding protein [Marinimicrococcus flavescens]|uniref:ABC transporter substrate-binding protein n=1 Tax=Marinimicrococcus flavescens TaxID=3031815 RepID=A0AAP4D4S7_9PROT|nr:ABC transporter substrate-binding protein [Marinimicrococcus flavescens]
MAKLTRRDGLILGLGAAAGAMLPGGRALRAQVPVADVQPPSYPIEKGAKLRVLRPSKFVKGDEELWLANSKKFTEQTGVEVIVQQESWADLRPKTAVAASVGSGPDVILAWQEDPHMFPGRMLPLDDLATYLGKKYGGWFPVCEIYGKNQEGQWIAMPIGGSGSTMVYRRSSVEKAGFDTFPSDFPGFLKLCQGLKKVGHPVGFALGNAVGDGGWTDWILWGFDSSLVDEQDNVIIDNPRTYEALEYARELYETFIPGTLAWLDPSNNKTYLSGDISLTGNGISVYYAAKNSDDPRMRELAEDTFHADYPIGPLGKPSQGSLVINAMVMAHTDYPNAAKEYLRFMMEKEQYVPWMEASIGYWCHPLAAYDESPVWTSDPKHEPYKNVLRKAMPQSWKGTPGEAASACKADYVVLGMFQSVCAGSMTPKEAAAEAQRRAERYYKA